VRKGKTFQMEGTTYKQGLKKKAHDAFEELQVV
jgi:hypothetical protein